MKSKKFKGEIYLLLCTLIWGSSFSVQKISMDHMDPLAFSFIRFICASFILLAISYYMSRKQSLPLLPRNADNTLKKDELKVYILAGLCCGSMLCIGVNLQQYALVTADAGKTGMIATLYVIFVPIISVLFKKKIPMVIWLSAVIAMLGIYLLSFGGGTGAFTIEFGDLLTLISTVFFAMQIYALDYFVARVNPLFLSFAQALTCGILSLIAYCFTPHVFDLIPSVQILWKEMFYSIFFVVGLGYSFQIIGQKMTPPATAAIIMSFESVFSVSISIIFLHETFTIREAFGILLMVTAIVLTQFNAIKYRFKAKRKELL